MRESLKAITQFFMIVLVLLSVYIWTFRAPDLVMLSLRFALPAAAAVLIWLLARNSFRREVLPDLLGRTVKKYFEHDGFCFALVPSVENGVCYANVFFQNRYSETCSAHVRFRPAIKPFSLLRYNIQGIVANIECAGGAFGVTCFPWPIPARFQGKVIRFDVGCSSQYPNGMGNLLRFRGGIRCGSAGGDLGPALASGTLAMTGVIYMSRPARLAVRFPKGVAEQNFTGASAITRILWQPDSPTRGFPVLPASSDHPI